MFYIFLPVICIHRQAEISELIGVEKNYLILGIKLLSKTFVTFGGLP